MFRRTRLPRTQTVATLGAPPAYRKRSPLTRRQMEVMRLIAVGYTNSQIAEALVITEGTAANHVAAILARLGLRNRVEAAVWLTHHLATD